MEGRRGNQASQPKRAPRRPMTRPTRGKAAIDRAMVRSSACGRPGTGMAVRKRRASRKERIGGNQGEGGYMGFGMENLRGRGGLAKGVGV